MKITNPYDHGRVSPYQSGADMWRDYRSQYGVTEALGICNRYLDLQVRTTDPEELRFCRELYAAMREDVPLVQPEKAPRESIIGRLHRAQAELREAPAGEANAKPARER